MLKEKTLPLLIFLALMFFSSNVYAGDVDFSEIAWMGTDVSSSDEWIELVNNTSADINLDNWQIVSTDGSPTITLSGTIKATNFYLLERTDDNSVPGVPADLIYSGALGNDGEDLVLKNSNGIIMDFISFKTSGWPAGETTTKETMQKNASGNWITGIGTPNLATANTTQNNNEDNNPEENNNSTELKNTPNPSEEKIIKETGSFKTLGELSGELLVIDSDIENNKTEIIFEAKRGSNLWAKGNVVWYFGDGITQKWPVSQPIFHNFEQAGAYKIMAEYFESDWQVKPDIILEKEIEILKPRLSLIQTEPFISIKNDGILTNISEWFIKDDFGNIAFLPRNLQILEKSTLNLSSEISKKLNSDSNNFYLINSSGSIVNTLTKNIIPTSITTTKIYTEPTRDKQVATATTLTVANSKTIDKTPAVTQTDTANSFQAVQNAIEYSSDKKNNILYYLLGFLTLIITSLLFLLHNKKTEKTDKEEYEILE